MFLHSTPEWTSSKWNHNIHFYNKKDGIFCPFRSLLFSFGRTFHHTQTSTYIKISKKRSDSILIARVQYWKILEIILTWRSAYDVSVEKINCAWKEEWLHQHENFHSHKHLQRKTFHFHATQEFFNFFFSGLCLRHSFKRFFGMRIVLSLWEVMTINANKIYAS